MRNTHFTFKTGEVGKRMRFFLEDAGGAFDLSAYTVTLNVGKLRQTRVINGAAVTKEPQSGATLGHCYHDLDATTANVVPGNYKGELKLVNGLDVLYWPTHADNRKSYFVVEVQPALG